MTTTDADTRERNSVGHAQGDSGDAKEGAPAPARADRPFGGLTPAEAAVRANATRREKKAEREAAAELDRLSVSGRVSTALAKEMSYAEVTAVIAALKRKAQEGSIQAIRELRSWLALAGIDGGAEDGDAIPWAEMSAEQRAAARAQLARELAELEESPAQG